LSGLCKRRAGEGSRTASCSSERKESSTFWSLPIDACSFQQNLAKFAIGVVVIVSPRIRYSLILDVIEPLRAAIGKVATGEVLYIML
jgi:hypothetical protein